MDSVYVLYSGNDHHVTRVRLTRFRGRQNDSFEWQVEEPRMFGPIHGISLVGIPRERLAGKP